MISAIAKTTGILISIVAIASAQTQVQTIAAQIDQVASQEQSRLGLESRIRAAERLCVADPPSAKILLDHALASLEKLTPPNNLVSRFTECYARIDLYGVEQATAHVQGRASVFVSLIRGAAEQKDFALATRFVREARMQGLYSVGGTTEYLTMLPAPSANEALREMIQAFPEHAGMQDVNALLNALGARRDFEEDLSREAIHRIFRAIGRPDFVRPDEKYPLISTFNLDGEQINTSGRYEAMLLDCAAYLAVYDFDAFKAHRAGMPEWWPLVALVSRNDLPGLMRVMPEAPQPGPEPAKPIGPPEGDGPFDQAFGSAKKLELPNRMFAMYRLSQREDLTLPQREALLKEMLTNVSDLPITYQLGSMRGIFFSVTRHHLQDFYEATAAKYLEILDVASRADDSEQYPVSMRGDLRIDYQRVLRFSEENHLLLPKHPALEMAALQLELDRTAAASVDFKLKSTNGTEYQLSKLKGKVVLLDFWAGMDPSTRDAAPVLDRLSRDLESKGLVLLGVSQGNARGIDNLRSNLGMSYPTLLDPDRHVHLLFGIDRNSQAGVPKSYVFDRQGKCVGVLPHPAKEEEIRAVLKQAGL